MEGHGARWSTRLVVCVVTHNVALLNNLNGTAKACGVQKGVSICERSQAVSSVEGSDELTYGSFLV